MRSNLIALQAQLNETVNLWVLEGVLVRNLDGIESTEALAIRVNAWDRVPAYISAAGKALLACLSDEEVRRMHGNRLPPWPSSHIPSMSALLDHLARVRRRGYATNMEEVAQGVFGVAVALRTPEGEPIAALSTGVPGVRFSRSRGEQIARLLIASATEMMQQLPSPAD